MRNTFSGNLKSARLKKGYTQTEVAKVIGVSNSTYSLYESGKCEPSIATMEKIAYALMISIDELFGLYDVNTKYLVKEPSKAYHVGSSYTWEEYYNLPDDEQAELINGELYYMSAPSRIHQELVGELYYVIKSYIKENHGLCKVYLAPFAVKLSEKEHTIVQPDISIVCDVDRLDERGCNGAPDLVIEVLSPSNKKRDTIDKLKLYADYDVREYWIVDADLRKVIVYHFFEDEGVPSIYGFDSEIKVNIFDGLYIRIEDFIRL